VHNIASSTLIENLWEAATSPKVSPHRDTTLQISNKLLDQGWLPLVDISDLIWSLDGRLNLIVSEIASALQIQTRALYPRPRAGQKTVYGQPAMSAADAANLLIDLERLGFDCDPTVLTEKLRPTLKRVQQLNDAELQIYWFPKNRHKSVPLILVEDPKNIGSFAKKLQTEGGYKVEIWRNSSGKATMFQAFAPRHRPDHGSNLWAA
jgi:hypothetical protein